jgi:hypothetical protein
VCEELIALHVSVCTCALCVFCVCCVCFVCVLCVLCVVLCVCCVWFWCVYECVFVRSFLYLFVCVSFELPR